VALLTVSPPYYTGAGVTRPGEAPRLPQTLLVEAG